MGKKCLDLAHANKGRLSFLVSGPGLMARSVFNRTCGVFITTTYFSNGVRFELELIFTRVAQKPLLWAPYGHIGRVYI